jgi:hypothetical protein
MKPDPKPTSPWLMIALPLICFALVVVGFTVMLRSSHHLPITHACHSNLQHIAKAKEHWAQQMQKSAGAIPTSADLLGYDKFLPYMPECPAGGNYAIGSVAEKPRCSLAGHTI